MKPRIFCMNSYFWLHSFYSPILPGNGETLTGTGYRPSGGGKGVNQAFAAAYLDCEVEVLGRMGKDEPGRIFARECASCGVGTRFIVYDEEHYTGCGCILRDERGGSAIVVVPGVQDFLEPADFDRAEEYIRTCVIGGFQLEVNLDTVLYAIRRCSEWGVKTFVDPAPAVPLPDDIYPCIDYIKPNEHEAAILANHSINVDNGINFDDVDIVSKAFQARGVGNLIITMGENGSIVAGKDGIHHTHCVKMPHVAGPTAAGDSFVAAFCTGLTAGLPQGEALAFASHTAAITVSRMGAMPSLPTVEEVQALLRERGYAGFDPAELDALK